MEYLDSISWQFFYAIVAIGGVLGWRFLFNARTSPRFFYRFREPSLLEYFRKFEDTKKLLEDRLDDYGELEFIHTKNEDFTRKLFVFEAIGEEIPS